MCTCTTLQTHAHTHTHIHLTYICANALFQLNRRLWPSCHSTGLIEAWLRVVRRTNRCLTNPRTRRKVAISKLQIPLPLSNLQLLRLPHRKGIYSSRAFNIARLPHSNRQQMIPGVLRASRENYFSTAPPKSCNNVDNLRSIKYLAPYLKYLNNIDRHLGSLLYFSRRSPLLE